MICQGPVVCKRNTVFAKQRENRPCSLSWNGLFGLSSTENNCPRPGVWLGWENACCTSLRTRGQIPGPMWKHEMRRPTTCTHMHTRLHEPIQNTDTQCLSDQFKVTIATLSAPVTSSDTADVSNIYFNTFQSQLVNEECVPRVIPMQQIHQKSAVWQVVARLLTVSP